jgi:MFS transporter, DHA2 family, methylenomycin A resistance protein
LSIAARSGPLPPARETRPAPLNWPVLATVCLGYFTASLAMAPISSILPTITRDLQLSIGEGGWIMTSYFLMLVGTVLVMGRLGDIFGHQRVFGLGAALFAAGALLCALSTSLLTLLLGRGIQGIGSAMIFATSLAIIATAIPVRRRGQAIGCLTMVASASSLAGVWFATWSVQHLSWQTAFFLPLPVGLAAALAGFRLRLQAAAPRSRRIDWLGAVVLFATITVAMLGLTHLHEGVETFAAGAPYHLSMHLAALVLFALFIQVERRAEAPLIAFRLMRNVNFSTGIIGNGIAHMSMLATSFVVPFLLERGRGLTPADTGLLVMAQGLSMVIGSSALGFIYDRTRWPHLAPTMLIGIATGLLLLGQVGGLLPYGGLVAIAVLLGGALGGFTTVNNTELMSLAPDGQQGFASGLVETTRQFGHAVGVNISSSLMAAALAGVSVATTEQYVAGFQQAALTMGLMATLGLLALVWPRLRSAIGAFNDRSVVGTEASVVTGRRPLPDRGD